MFVSERWSAHGPSPTATKWEQSRKVHTQVNMPSEAAVESGPKGSTGSPSAPADMEPHPFSDPETGSSPATGSDPDTVPDRDTGSKPVACIELDRFCEECSYNLRTLPVYRDARTDIAVVQCTECGRYQSANDTATALRPWLGRVTSVLLVGWMLVIAAAFIWLGMAQGAISYATLDELTVYGGSTVRRVGNQTIRTYSSGRGPLEVQTDIPYYEWFVGSVMGVSCLIAMVSGLIAVVVFPHWRWFASLALVFGLSIGAAAIITLSWRFEAPELLGWSAPYIGGHLCAQLFGGAVGVTIGRPMARLIVRVIFPPSIRPRLAYLWHADGKALPTP